MKHPKPKPPVPAPGSSVAAEFWRPDWKWHLKLLAGIYVFLAIFYFAVDHWLSRLPEPYGLRDIPAEMTPWLKK